MFEINDKVKWFDSFGNIPGFIPNYGWIVNLTPKFADVFDTRLEKVVRVKQSILTWD